jgi:hypothetical protein
VAATFSDDSLQVGVVDLKDRQAFCLLNWGDTPTRVSLPLARRHQLRDLWTDDDLGRREGPVSLTLGARDGRVITATPA